MALLQWHMVYKLGEDELHRHPVVALNRGPCLGVRLIWTALDMSISFLQLSSFERLKYLMTSKEPSIIQATMKYITDMINQRKSTLKNPDAHRVNSNN